jgi:hypothetical protein
MTRIELFKDGDQFGIVTDATTEREFVQGFSELLGGLISDDVVAAFESTPGGSVLDVNGGHYGTDWWFQLSYWLPQMIEIACALRGHESDARRVLSAGDLPRRVHRFPFAPPRDLSKFDFERGVFRD